MFNLVKDGKEKMTMRAKRTKAQALNNITYQLYYNQFSNIVLNNFKWDNLPNGLLSRRFEKYLYEYGICAFFYDEKLKEYIVLPVTNNGNLDIYSEPVKWAVTGYGYDNFNLDTSNSVLIRNNYYATSSIDITKFYANKITDVQRVIDVQLEQIKTPYLIKTSDRKLLTHKNILAKKEDGEIAIFVTDSINVDDFNLFPTPTNYVIDKLIQYKANLESEFHQLFGFDNVETQKNERLVVAEIEKNEEATNSGYSFAMLEMRKEAVEKINELFGLDITVQLNREEPKIDRFEWGEDDDLQRYDQSHDDSDGVV